VAVVIAKVTEDPEDLKLERVVEILKAGDEMGEVGGIASFLGTVKRSVEDGGRVEELVYENIRSAAEEAVKKIAEEEAMKWGLKGIAVIHRIGRLKPGEPTMLVAVAAASRKQAFPALEETVERVKSEVPIFKLERREDGDYWIVGERKRVKKGGR